MNTMENVRAGVAKMFGGFAKDVQALVDAAYGDPEGQARSVTIHPMPAIAGAVVSLAMIWDGSAEDLTELFFEIKSLAPQSDKVYDAWVEEEPSSCLWLLMGDDIWQSTRRDRLPSKKHICGNEEGEGVSTRLLSVLVALEQHSSNSNMLCKTRKR
ncbi:hypothetical protein NA57DRAFT_56713 [Rhizodiscina lignyota]|uniref:Uncharacterized protein n=1 Tax=Rhizodiscina lignyota TaxID=1504668 RepID=A0A9P4M977_9PEZI|nr:hypothetical protein NA57DRAFT_56713 [Rhizodiscina lignyota]